MKTRTTLWAHCLALLMILTLAATSNAAPAPEAPAHAKLSKIEQADVARIEQYLNELKSISANFMQVSDAGNFRRGEIAIERPGKMRVIYDEPDKDFIIADGTFVHIWDDEMDQQTSIPVGEGVSDFILRDHIKLSDDIVITRYARYPAKIEVSLVSVKEPDEGELTLIFEDKPLRLRQWRVLDPQGRTTGVNLENMREGVSFPENTFVFVSPKLGQTPNSSHR